MTHAPTIDLDRPLFAEHDAYRLARVTDVQQGRAILQYGLRARLPWQDKGLDPDFVPTEPLTLRAVIQLALMTELMALGCTLLEAQTTVRARLNNRRWDPVRPSPDHLAAPRAVAVEQRICAAVAAGAVMSEV